MHRKKSLKAEVERLPVLLIQGIFDTVGVFLPMKNFLEKSGWKVYIFEGFPTDARFSIEEMAEKLKEYIDKTFPLGQKIDIIGYSMGGIVGRYYLQKMHGFQRVKRFIGLSAPNYGALWAFFLPLKAVKQMRIGGNFLRDLNRDISQLKKVQCTFIWTPFDLMIMPARSSRMPFGKLVKVSVLTHPWMAISRKSLGVIGNALSEFF